MKSRPLARRAAKNGELHCAAPTLRIVLFQQRGNPGAGTDLLPISVRDNPGALLGGCTNSEAAFPNLGFRMPNEPPLPLDAISTTEPYALYSQTTGLISGHKTAREAVKAFAQHAINNPDTDALIYSREVDGWQVV